MGNICCDVGDGHTCTLLDLAKPSVTGLRDTYSIWEYDTAWKITYFQAYSKAVKKAELDSGGEGFVTLDKLKEYLNTKAWSALKKRDSKLSKMLLSSAF